MIGHKLFTLAALSTGLFVAGQSVSAATITGTTYKYNNTTPNVCCDTFDNGSVTEPALSNNTPNNASGTYGSGLLNNGRIGQNQYADGTAPDYRNNIGYALHQLGRYDEALAQFTRAVALREKGTDVQATRIAYWMVAWTLRAMDRTQEALDIQLRLERERDADGTPSPDVFEELESLYRQKGDTVRANFYADRRKGIAK